MFVLLPRVDGVWGVLNTFPRAVLSQACKRQQKIVQHKASVTTH